MSFLGDTFPVWNETDLGIAQYRLHSLRSLLGNMRVQCHCGPAKHSPPASRDCFVAPLLAMTGYCSWHNEWPERAIAKLRMTCSLQSLVISAGSVNTLRWAAMHAQDLATIPQPIHSFA
jgi:hypothetical protein